MKTKIAFGILFFCTLFSQPKVHAMSSDNSYQRLVLTLLEPNIQTQINEYYKYKLTAIPMFAPFLGGNNMDFKYLSSGINVVVTVTPYVGPHLSVGRDRLKFQIDNSGNIEVIKYEHIEDYKLPPVYMRTGGKVD